MKYCSYCGNPMEDEMKFCQKCGKKFIGLEISEEPEQAPDIVEEENEDIIEETPSDDSISDNDQTTDDKFNDVYSYGTEEPEQPMPVKRKGLRGLAIFNAIITLVFVLMGIIEKQFGIVAFGVFYAVIAAMFYFLSRTPKNTKFVFLNKSFYLGKTKFIVLSIAIAFIIFFLMMMIDANFEEGITKPMETQQPAQTSEEQMEETNSPTPTQNKETIKDVEKWYNDHMSEATQSLVKYSDSIQGLTNMNVDESKFRFGEDSGWYDCHYTIYFTCKIDGELCQGEARGFRKYKEDDIHWFHYEISRKSDNKTMVETYEDEYDDILEDYYKELQSKYGS